MGLFESPVKGRRIDILDISNIEKLSGGCLDGLIVCEGYIPRPFGAGLVDFQDRSACCRRYIGGFGKLFFPRKSFYTEWRKNSLRLYAYTSWFSAALCADWKQGKETRGGGMP